MINAVKVLRECLQFLITKRMRSLFATLISAYKVGLFWHDRMTTGNNEDGDCPYDEWNEDPEYVAKSLLVSLARVPWADEFARLEMEHKAS